jgi:GT2 family glycosyltransferase
MEPHVPTLQPAPRAPGPFSPGLPVDAPGSPEAALRLSVVVVTYRQWRDAEALVARLGTAACVRSGAVEIVVVDNASPIDPAVARLRRATGVSLRRWGRNRGFAAAVNEGARLSRGEWLLLLNPDVTPTHGFLDAALSAAERRAAAEPRLGALGFRLRNPDGSPQGSTGRFPTLASTLLGLLRPRARRKYDGGPTDRPRRVDWATGCCLLIRRPCWDALGGLDGDFFLYYEDVDFCRRAAAAGWSVGYEPAAAVVHHRPLHGRPAPPRLRMITRHALLTYAGKHWPAWQARLLAAAVWVEAWGRRLSAQRAAEAEAFAGLRAVAAALFRGRTADAARLVRRAVRRLDGA